MGGSLIKDCITDNILKNNDKVNVIFVHKQNLNSHNIINCYIDEKFKPINMPFKATFCEDYTLKNIKKDFNTKNIENFFGVDINTFFKLVSHKPTKSFNNYDNLFFDSFKINNSLFDINKSHPTNFENCKKLNENFILISSDDYFDVFSIFCDNILPKNIKLVFAFDKKRNFLDKIEVYSMNFKIKDYVITDVFNFNNEQSSNMRNVFIKLFDNDFPVFIDDDILFKIKTIEDIYPMIFSIKIDNFINTNIDVSFIEENNKKSFKNLTNDIINHINNKKNKKLFFFQIKDVFYF